MNTRNKIIEIVKKNYKCVLKFNNQEDKKNNTLKFYFLDINQIEAIGIEIGLILDDIELCKCGCRNTEAEIVTNYIDLEFNAGTKIPISDYVYFRLGRNVWGTVGRYYQRLSILRYILEDLQKHFLNAGIKSKLDISDAEPQNFCDYFKKK
jgi:hypothetical protein